MPASACGPFLAVPTQLVCPMDLLASSGSSVLAAVAATATRTMGCPSAAAFLTKTQWWQQQQGRWAVPRLLLARQQQRHDGGGSGGSANKDNGLCLLDASCLTATGAAPMVGRLAVPRLPHKKT
jgi:hypothetical protein